MKLFINSAVLFLIGFTYWFFFMKKENQEVKVKKEITIIVKGGYNPAIIKIKKGQSVTLKFQRKDESSCLEELVIPDFGIRRHLRLNKTTKIKINPQKVGEYEFTCGMNMFRGKIKVGA